MQTNKISKHQNSKYTLNKEIIIKIKIYCVYFHNKIHAVCVRCSFDQLRQT